MTRVIAGIVIAAVLGIIGFSVYAWATAPSQGYVKNVSYSAGWSSYTPGGWSSSCVGAGAGRTCTNSYTPGYWTSYPPDWQLQLCSKPLNVSQGNSCGWRDVDQQTYDTVRIGQYWPPREGQ